VAKKTSSEPVVAAPPVEGMEPFRERLLLHREEKRNLYNQDIRAGQDSTDEGTEDIVDRANAAYNREFMFSLSDVERQTMLQIEDALQRIDEGTYGRCANCSRTIAAPRLEAIPWTRFCIDCQELAEKGLLNEADFS
jgi:DnaK suppressor protein